MDFPDAQAVVSGHMEQISSNPFVEVVHSLFDSSNPLQIFHKLPLEVKYIAIALSSENGPLEGLFVASGSFTASAPEPAIISLLPRTPTFINSILETCSEAGSQSHVIEVR